MFGDRLDLATRFGRHLATTGVAHGLVGPREVPRLWGRHLLNCAVLTDLLPQAARVIDIGSGAGLPGLALAIRRPDLHVALVEPLLRRVTWLERVVDDLQLAQVDVLRGRAQDVAGSIRAPFVTARAVAPLSRLVGWALPLLEPNGTMLALKGRAAQDELDQALRDWPRAIASADVLSLGSGMLDEPTTVVRVVASASASADSRHDAPVARPTTRRRSAGSGGGSDAPRRTPRTRGSSGRRHERD